jgi:hypothetical protein
LWLLFALRKREIDPWTVLAANELVSAKCANGTILLERPAHGINPHDTFEFRSASIEHFDGLELAAAGCVMEAPHSPVERVWYGPVLKRDRSEKRLDLGCDFLCGPGRMRERSTKTELKKAGTLQKLVARRIVARDINRSIRRKLDMTSALHCDLNLLDVRFAHLSPSGVTCDESVPSSRARSCTSS